MAQELRHIASLQTSPFLFLFVCVFASFFSDLRPPQVEFHIVAGLAGLYNDRVLRLLSFSRLLVFICSTCGGRKSGENKNCEEKEKSGTSYFARLPVQVA